MYPSKESCLLSQIIYWTLANRVTYFSANIQVRRDNILVESNIHVRIKSQRTI